jgi:methylthioribose-1-phosphate isomerase
MSLSYQTIEWNGGIRGRLVLLDQTRLPAEVVYLECPTVEDVWQAIHRLSVRGAPAIGVTAAYGVCVGVQTALDDELDDARRRVAEVSDYLATSRPTAVNLFWALERMCSVARKFEPQFTASQLAERLLHEARAIQSEDRQMSVDIGRHGADLLADLPTAPGILTHCNTGALISGGGEGSALAIVLELKRRDKQPHVWADETRPLLQGARLTMWELQQAHVDATLICDSMAAQVMREGRVQAVITGADRIAANGDAANKIGTYSVATLACAHGIPFYVAAPITTFDLEIESGADIPIEQRAAEEVTRGFGSQTAPAGATVYNPAFDVTPAELITAIVTDRGIIRPVNENTVRSLAT